MLAHIHTIGRIGIHCFPIVVEVDVSPGMPGFTIVGLADTIVHEAKERIRAAIKNSNLTFPLSRITINLAPADVRKEGIGFDLPIAVGILVASEQLPPPPNNTLFYGELGLQGEIKATRGVLSVVKNAPKGTTCYIPAPSSAEAGLVATQSYAVHSLEELVQIFKNERPPIQVNMLSTLPTPAWIGNDFADIHGQHAAKRALEIAAAGHHNILLSGPPGSGKTLLARALPSILPPLSRDETVEATEIQSVAGTLSPHAPVVTARPFRAPHHSASMVSLIGGGNPPRPGEISLAHQGVLFLDEFTELPRSVIEAMRQPLEDKTITVARAGTSATFPAHALLIGALNPCPCGYFDDPQHACSCTPQQLVTYAKKLSGPILDRIDLHVTVPAVPVGELTGATAAEPSEAIRARVTTARIKQRERYQASGFTTNSQLNGKAIAQFCPQTSDAQHMLARAVDKLKLSARSYHRVLKLSRTIADLANEDVIQAPHIAEALRYRPQLSIVV